MIKNLAFKILKKSKFMAKNLAFKRLGILFLIVQLAIKIYKSFKANRPLSQAHQLSF